MWNGCTHAGVVGAGAHTYWPRTQACTSQSPAKMALNVTEGVPSALTFKSRRT